MTEWGRRPGSVTLHYLLGGRRQGYGGYIVHVALVHSLLHLAKQEGRKSMFGYFDLICSSFGQIYASMLCQIFAAMFWWKTFRTQISVIYLWYIWYFWYLGVICNDLRGTNMSHSYISWFIYLSWYLGDICTDSLGTWQPGASQIDDGLCWWCWCWWWFMLIYICCNIWAIFALIL